MQQPSFLDLLMPTLEKQIFTITIDGFGTGVWDFGHVNESRYKGELTTVPVEWGCRNMGGSWIMAGISAVFPEQQIQEIGCVLLGEWGFLFF